MSGVLHPKLPVPARDLAFDDEPTGTATSRAPRAPVVPLAEAAVDVDVDENIDDDADSKIISRVRERHPRIQH